jgi:hypothetical protein
MNEPAYPFTVSDDALDYSFESVSDQKVITKVIRFNPFRANPIFYNMALVDVLDDGTTNDLVVSNNQDMPVILATVAKALLMFFDHYPRKLIYFTGSDEQGYRNRLYRIVVSRELGKVVELFDIYGQLPDESFEDFQPNRPYKAFIFQKR